MDSIPYYFLSLCIFLSTFSSWSASGLLFQVTSDGPALSKVVSFNLCLNINGIYPLSCQTYTTAYASIHIRTTTPNHSYYSAGIKINTPGYMYSTTASSNGYASLGVISDTEAVTGTISELSIYTVTPTGDGFEDISPSTPQSVHGDSTQAFTVTAHTNYTLSQSVGGNCPAGSWSGDRYTTGTITNSCSVIFSASLNTNTVTPSGDGNESYLPNSPHLVAYGSTLSFAVTATTGYAISNTVGGTCPSGSWSNLSYHSGTYTTGSITNNCTVSFSATAPTLLGGGYYFDGVLTSYPLVALSTNFGSSWSYPSTAITPVTSPTYKTTDYGIEAAACTGTNCIIAASYRDTDNIIRPLLGVSNDSGNTWTYPSSITMPNTDPTFARSGYLYGASCYGTLCIAAGSYIHSAQITPTPPIYPLVALSNDAGANWTFPPSITQPTTVPTFSTITYDLQRPNASCYGSLCIAVWQYKDGSGIARPLLALTKDAGSTWTYPSAITMPTTNPSFSNSGYLEGTSCYESICIAVGSYSDSNGRQDPLLTPVMGFRS